MANHIREDFDLLHDIAPGRHFYQFYKSPDDLLKVLLRYWVAGIRKGHYCFWSLPAFMTADQAISYLKETIPEIDRLISQGSFEIILHNDWYGNGEHFDGDEMIRRYDKKIKAVLKKGYSVFRLAADASGFKPQAWAALKEYEKKGHAIIHRLPCIALCSYPLHELRLQQTKDVLDSHHGVLVAKV